MKFLSLVAVATLALTASAQATTAVVEAPPALVVPPVLEAGGRRGVGSELQASIQQAIAASLGTTVGDVVNAVQSGQSVEELATASGIDLDAVRDAALSDFIQNAVREGLLTAEEAESMTARFQERPVGGGKFGQKGHGKKKNGGSKFGGAKSQKKERGAKIEGLKEAVEETVEAALKLAGLEKPDRATATREEMQAFKQAVQDSGFDADAVKAEAALTFVQAGEANGSISADVATKFYASAAERQEKQLEREVRQETMDDIKNATSEAVAAALGMSVAELDALHEAKDRDAVLAKVKEAGVDLKAVKDAVMKEFLAAAVEAGDMTQEEADKLASRKESGKFGGKKGSKGGKGGKKGNKRGGNKFGGHKSQRKGGQGKGGNRNQFGRPQQTGEAPPAVEVPPEASVTLGEFRSLPANANTNTVAGRMTKTFGAAGSHGSVRSSGPRRGY